MVVYSVYLNVFIIFKMLYLLVEKFGIVFENYNKYC